MLRIVEDEQAIKRYLRRFLSHFRALPHRKEILSVGHRGKSYTVRVFWLDSLGIWLARDWRGDYFRHIFGLVPLSSACKVSTTCEINFPRSGIDRRLGGAFALDSAGRVYVIHRGLLGGRKGMGKGLFLREYRGVWAEIEEGDRVSSVVVVGDLASVRFPRQVAQFVRQIVEIKEKEEPRDERQIAMPLELDSMPEIYGLETFEDTRKNLSLACDLGLAVQDLTDEIESQGVKVKAQGPTCLSCRTLEGEKEVYFYVLPDSRGRSIREGAIHLFFLALRSRLPCRLILVLPEKIDDFLKERLREFSIETFVFQWNKDKAIFSGLKL
ncbi:MAG: hypothetical protein N2572_06925 [Syntrophales bacterium]|nr:hypothetical protein [Syntrophales bacterium]